MRRVLNAPRIDQLRENHEGTADHWQIRMEQQKETKRSCDSPPCLRLLLRISSIEQ